MELLEALVTGEVYLRIDVKRNMNHCEYVQSLGMINTISYIVHITLCDLSVATPLYPVVYESISASQLIRRGFDAYTIERGLISELTIHVSRNRKTYSFFCFSLAIKHLALLNRQHIVSLFSPCPISKPNMTRTPLTNMDELWSNHV